MPSPGWIRATIGLLALLMVLFSTLTGDSIDEAGLRWLGGATGAVTFILLAFDQVLWRLAGLRQIGEALGHPAVHGTWRGRMRYERDGNGEPGEMEFYAAIKQTLSAVSVRCYFPSTGSESWSLAAALTSNDHRHDLRYIFQQRAPVPAREHNRPSEGACELTVSGRPVSQLSGSYYSERGGCGTIELDEYSPKLAGSLHDAQGLTFERR